jgi:hypothetical protein
MAHASSLEAAKNKMKKLRKQKANKRAANAQIPPEEKARLIQERFSKTLAEEVNVALYDYDLHQYPRVKYGYLAQLLKDRLKELRAELRTKPDLSEEYNALEKETFIQCRNKRLNALIEKIERIQVEIGGEENVTRKPNKR